MAQPRRLQGRRPFSWRLVAGIIIIAISAFVVVSGWIAVHRGGPNAQDDAEGHYARGVFAQMLGDLHLAAHEFGQALLRDPGHQDAQQGLTQVFLSMTRTASPDLPPPATDAPPTIHGTSVPTETPHVSASATAAEQTAQAAVAATLTAQAQESEALDGLHTAIAATLTAQVTPTPSRTATLRPTPSPTTTPRPTSTPTADRAADLLARHGPQTLSWVVVPAGDFTMGSSEDELWDAVAFCNQSEGNCQFDWFDDELPQRIANTGAYQINRYEITNAQYNVCVSMGGCLPAGRIVSDANIPYNSLFFADNYPVVAVSKDDAATYCAWAGGRLPTEIEWEKAARGLDGRIYPWGNEFRGDAAKVAASAPAPVGSFPVGVSPYGVHDLAGNAFEWTASAIGNLYVLRGGGWRSFPFRARAADRGTKLPANFANYDIGFRCVR